MEFRILGPLEFITAGTAVALGGEKQRAVLAMLVLHVNHALSTDLLIDGLWGQAPPENATNTVQAYVSRLRKAMARGGSAASAEWVIRRRGPGYLLETDPAVVDLNRFQRLAQEGIEKLTVAPDVASKKLAEALVLWRGTPLAEFTGEPFAQTELPRLQEQWLSALTARMDAELALGHHSRLVGELEALIADHPLHEGLRGQLMVSLYRSGRQAEALEAYRRTRQSFAEQLGIEPGRRLQELEAAILAHDRGLEWIAPAIAAQPLPIPVAQPQMSADPDAAGFPAIWNVPPRNPHFSGRDGTLDELHARLHSPARTMAVQALYGLGGVGKSQIAIEYAHRFAAEYALVWWIDAELTVLIPEQLIMLGERLGLPAQGTAGDMVNLLLGRLGSRTDWLLIWDNVERPDDIADYRPAGGGHFLVTSRSPRWGALGGRMEIEVLPRPETVILLRARIGELTDRVGDELAAELGDLPLAAAQAAAYLEQSGLDPEQYLRRFRTRRAALMERGDVLGYQGRVDTAWNLSLERLRAENPIAVALLEVAAFLAPEPIPLSLFTDHPEDLAEPLRAALLADPETIDDAVGAGVGYSLVRRRDRGFQQHRLVQAVIRHQLPPQQQRTVAAQAVRLLAGANPGDPNDPANWTAFARIAPHVLAVGPLGDEDEGWRRLMLATVTYLNARGSIGEVRLIAEELLARWRQVLGADHPDTLTVAASVTAALAWLADHDKARALGRDTLGRARTVLGVDHPVTLRLVTHLVFAMAWLGESAEACRLGEDNLDRAKRVFGEESSDTLRLAANLAFALAWHGEPIRARDLARATWIRASSALGPDHPVTLLAAAHLGIALGWLGETEQDLEVGEDTLTRSRTALGPDHPTSLGSAAHLAFILISQDAADRARQISQDTLERARRALGEHHLITLVSMAILAWALASLGDADGARSLGTEALGHARRQLGADNLITLMAAGALTAALAELGDTVQARTLGGDALERSTVQLGVDHLITKRLTYVLAQLAGQAGPAAAP